MSAYTKRRLIASLLIIATGFATHASAITHYVSTNSPSPSSPYTNWHTAARIIQQAIDACAPGETVLVSNGVYSSGGKTYAPGLLTNRVVVSNGISLKSVNGPEVTTIVGSPDPYTGKEGSNAVRCLYVYESFAAGFTLSNGFTRTSPNSIWDKHGGGVFIDDGVLSNCIVRDCYADSAAGGIHADDVSTIHSCVIAYNVARGYAGGLYFNGRSRMINSVVVYNKATNYSGGIERNYGGNIENCTIAFNEADAVGGIGDHSSGPIINSIVYHNVAALDDNHNNNTSFHYSCTTPLPLGAGNMDEDPNMVSPATGNWRLRGDSPCVDRGTELAWQTNGLDIEGDPRIFGANVDIGADEVCVLATSIGHTGSSVRSYWSVPVGSTVQIFYAIEPDTAWLPLDPSSVASTSSLMGVDNTGTSGRCYRVQASWPDPTLPLMVTPYSGLEHMSGINEAYSESAACPWGFEHRGIDFFATNLFKQFRACESGTVYDITKFMNEGNSNWQVNVRIQHNDKYAFGYAFEPMSSSSNHGDTQLANLIVTAGQHLARSDSLGYLYVPSNGAHVHYDFYTNWTPICPEPYFMETARTSILHLIDIVWPNADMCY